MSTITHLQPDGLVDVRGFGFSHVTVTSGSKIIHVSGQVSVDEQGQPVGIGDIKAQTRQVMNNLELALASAGANFTDVVKFGVFIVNYDPSVRGDIMAIRNEFVDPHDAPASTVIGVQALAAPEYLIEIEASAALDGD